MSGILLRSLYVHSFNLLNSCEVGSIIALIFVPFRKERRKERWEAHSKCVVSFKGIWDSKPVFIYLITPSSDDLLQPPPLRPAPIH